MFCWPIERPTGLLFVVDAGSDELCREGRLIFDESRATSSDGSATHAERSLANAKLRNGNIKQYGSCIPSGWVSRPHARAGSRLEDFQGLGTWVANVQGHVPNVSED